MQRITTIGELKEAISKFKDDDAIVVETHEGVRGEDLYDFTIEEIKGIRLVDGTEISEIRICI